MTTAKMTHDDSVYDIRLIYFRVANTLQSASDKCSIENATRNIHFGAR